MSFANPIALWALAGLLVPLLIHLFSHDRGRRLPFAAVRFIPGFKSQQLRSPRLSQWLLFLLRCLLLALLAVMLARPVLRGDVRLVGNVAVLVSPLAVLAGAERTLALANQIARDNGTEPRLLGSGFPFLSKHAPGGTDGAWSLLAELQSQIDPETDLLVLIADDPRESLARKPLFDHQLEWSVITGPAPQAAIEPLRVGLLAVAERRRDIEFLGATLETLQASGVDVRTSVFESLAGAAGQDVLIVLSDDPCPGPAQGQLIICDANQSSMTAGQALETIVDFAGVPFDLQLGAQADTGRVPDGEVLLRTRSGQGVALLDRSGDGSRLLWNSRFNPEHAAIVGSRYFPDLLRDLIWENHFAMTASGTVGDDQGGRPAFGIEVWLPALLVLLLWLLERWFSGRKPVGGGDETLSL